MRDVLGSGYRRSLVHLAWMCLFSSLPVRGKLGRPMGQQGWHYRALAHHERARSWLCCMFLPISRCRDAGKPVWGDARCHGGAGRPAWQRAGGSDPALGLQNGRAKVLEKTFEEWMRYRDECLRRMASEPYPPGSRL